jgi:hypothetical protein
MKNARKRKRRTHPTLYKRARDATAGAESAPGGWGPARFGTEMDWTPLQSGLPPARRIVHSKNAVAPMMRIAESISCVPEWQRTRRCPRTRNEARVCCALHGVAARSATCEHAPHRTAELCSLRTIPVQYRARHARNAAVLDESAPAWPGSAELALRAPEITRTRSYTRPAPLLQQRLRFLWKAARTQFVVGRRTSDGPHRQHRNFGS